MFGPSYYGTAYFGPSYYPPGGEAVPVTPAKIKSKGGRAWRPWYIVPPKTISGSIRETLPGISGYVEGTVSYTVSGDVVAVADLHLKTQAEIVLPRLAAIHATIGITSYTRGDIAPIIVDATVKGLIPDLAGSLSGQSLEYAIHSAINGALNLRARTIGEIAPRIVETSIHGLLDGIQSHVNALNSGRIINARSVIELHNIAGTVQGAALKRINKTAINAQVQTISAHFGGESAPFSDDELAALIDHL